MDLFWILIGVAGLALLAGIAGFLSRGHHAAKSQIGVVGYERVEKLMSEAERSFFGVLKQIAGSEFQVFSKVRIADVLAPSPNLHGAARRAALNRIISRHFDYVVCSATDLKILCAVELDDRSHQRRDRKERDAFVEQACASGSLPLVRIAAAARYSPQVVSEKLGAAIRSNGV